jgi:hypothetical protein
MCPVLCGLNGGILSRDGGQFSRRNDRSLEVKMMKRWVYLRILRGTIIIRKRLSGPRILEAGMEDRVSLRR